MTDKNPSSQKTIIEDRYLGKVSGNRLDAYNNSTYNIRLYMIPDKTDSGGGYMNGAMKANLKKLLLLHKQV